MARTRPTSAHPFARSAVLGSVAAVALLLTGCSASPAPAGSSGTDAIVLYSAQHEQTTAALVAAFTKRTGIRVRIDSGDEDELTAKLKQEGARSPADVFLTENSNWLEQLDAAHLLSKVDASTFATIPAADSAATQDWIAVSARVSALVYNTKDLAASQLPTSVLGLADPRWRGELEIAPAETDFWPIISSVEHTYGHAKALAWLEGLKANAGTAVAPDNETLVDDVNRGTRRLGLINHYYFERLSAEQGASGTASAIDYFAAGDPGYLETFSGAGVLKSSTHQAEAQRFIAFLTGKDGQEALARSASFEYPLAAGVAANAADTPLAELKPSTAFTPAEFGTGADAQQLLEEAQLL